MKRFGEKLGKLRKRHGLTQKEVAEFLVVHRSHVTRIESGEKIPHAEMIIKIAHLFKVSADLLMMDELELD